MFIQRKRWVVRKKSDNTIMCGLQKNYKFCGAHELGDAKICTYMSESKAYYAARTSFNYTGEDVVAEPVIEIVASYVEE